MKRLFSVAIATVLILGLNILSAVPAQAAGVYGTDLWYPTASTPAEAFPGLDSPYNNCFTLNNVKGEPHEFCFPAVLTDAQFLDTQLAKAMLLYWMPSIGTDNTGLMDTACYVESAMKDDTEYLHSLTCFDNSGIVVGFNPKNAFGYGPGKQEGYIFGSKFTFAEPGTETGPGWIQIYTATELNVFGLFKEGYIDPLSLTTDMVETINQWMMEGLSNGHPPNSLIFIATQNGHGEIQNIISHPL